LLNGDSYSHGQKSTYSGIITYGLVLKTHLQRVDIAQPAQKNAPSLESIGALNIFN
jgi:hypothetical protein